jgi:hypothetical protein
MHSSYHFPDHDWVFWVVALQKVICGESTIQLPDEVQRYDISARTRNFVASTPLSVVPGNLRFRLTEFFPDQELRQEAKNWYRGRDNGQEKIEKIMRQANKVFEEGFREEGIVIPNHEFEMASGVQVLRAYVIPRGIL